MLVSINWIKDYVDLDGCDIKGLINKFTLATAEVEDIYYMGRDVQNVVVGEIKTLEEKGIRITPDNLKITPNRRSFTCSQLISATKQ